MSKLMQSIDERTRLAGTNRLELLLFNLGKDRASQREEVYGINVFKVKEVMLIPEITKAPDMPDGVEGIVSLRGETLPVINLQRFCSIDTDDIPGILIVTEYNRHLQGFLVHSVDSIKRVTWSDVKAPPPMMANRHGGLITAVSETPEHGLIMILDVEKVLADTAGLYETDHLFSDIEKDSDVDITILYVDDSAIARKQIEGTLQALGYKYIAAENGLEAWKKLKFIAEKSELSGEPCNKFIQLVLTDIEMPEMDGYVLTKKIKDDNRFAGIPVVMHSSLTTESNRAIGASVGSDEYVAKFKPSELAATLRKVLISHNYLDG